MNTHNFLIKIQSYEKVSMALPDSAAGLYGL
jgi:hypothetical protein